MLNILWPIFIIISYIYAIMVGRIEEINTSIFDSVSNAVELCITLLRYNVLVEWNNANCIANKFAKKNNKIVKTTFKIFISGNKRRRRST